jgi:predicted enzyme related to lactoylglutathione lyase
MPTVTEHPAGVPSWIDLATPDTEAARSFYNTLFGWEYDEQPAGDDGATYVMAQRGGRAAAGMMKLSDEMAASGMPPAWSSYVTVTDLDAVAGRVGSAGGAVMQPPMDVMDAGRMAVCADPGGAVFCLWEAKENIGAEVVGEHGSLVWNELITPDPAAVSPFYADVLGWTAETVSMPGGEYTLFHVEGGNPQGIAGCATPPMAGMPSFWVVYFAVDDCDATVATARANGASVLAEPMDLPEVGRMAALTDPQGAAFSILQPAS